MSNKLAVLKLYLSYTGPTGDQIAPSPVQVQCPYTSEVAGTIDVPDTTAAAHDYSVPFGAIATECTCALIVNNTKNGVNPGTDLGVKINGAASESHRIPPGGALLIAAPLAATGTPRLTSLHLIVKTTQAGDGQIAFFLFGDPA